ncbi:hypothetical protein pdam_00009397 [Pocillopora damicornis]|uniref:Uncharacterized protein n=1 Tax=Pocillopora damicornis TaxID=46731 RepID=A0A3M6TLB7_POCDA|nr:hypothetical protein pdam_00009397 [Pocillopora damicornis]
MYILRLTVELQDRSIFFMPARMLAIARNHDKGVNKNCPQTKRSLLSQKVTEDLPTNFRINSLLDLLAIKECSATGVKCGNCEESSSQSFYCFQCCAFWCETNCISLHNGIKANKEHTHIPH